MRLEDVPGEYSVCRLPPDAAIPTNIDDGFYSVTRTDAEVSLVCLSSAVPTGCDVEPAWRCLRIAGQIPFELTGVLASLVDPLRDAGISIFAISTFDTDYLLVKSSDYERAIQALCDSGFSMS